MISILPDGAPPTERPVHRPRHADGQAPEAAAKCPRVVGLDDEMDVVVLYTEMENPEAAVGGRGERAADGREESGGSKAAERAPEGGMHRVRGTVCRPAAVRDARPAARRELAAGAGATAAPGARRGK